MNNPSRAFFFFFFSFADLTNNSLQCSNFSDNLSNLHTWREKWVFSAIFTEERNRISLRWRAWLYILWKVGSRDSTDTNPSIRSLASLPLGKEDVQAVGCTTPEGAARPCEDENAGRQPRGPVKTRGLPISSSNLLLMVWHRTGNIVSDTLWPSRLLLSVWPCLFHSCLSAAFFSTCLAKLPYPCCLPMVLGFHSKHDLSLGVSPSWLLLSMARRHSCTLAS